MARENFSDCLSDEVSERRVHTSPNRLATIRMFKVEARSPPGEALTRSKCVDVSLTQEEAGKTTKIVGVTQ